MLSALTTITATVQTLVDPLPFVVAHSPLPVYFALPSSLVGVCRTFVDSFIATSVRAHFNQLVAFHSHSSQRKLIIQVVISFVLIIFVC